MTWKVSLAVVLLTLACFGYFARHVPRADRRKLAAATLAWGAAVTWLSALVEWDRDRAVYLAEWKGRLRGMKDGDVIPLDVYQPPIVAAPGPVVNPPAGLEGGRALRR